MKYFASLLIAVPLVASCTVIQDDYYAPNYHGHSQYIPVTRTAHHAHAPVHRVQPNTHGHKGPVVRHRAVRAGTTHGHVEAKPNVHGHNEPKVRPQARNPGTPVQVPSRAHGHN